MAAYVLAYGIGLMGLALFTNRVSPEPTQLAVIASLAGGGLCAMWGMMGLLGYRRRVGAVLTLIPVCLILIAPVVQGWMDVGSGNGPTLLLTVLTTVMLIATVGLLAYLLHSGEHGAAPRALAGGKQRLS